MTIEEILGLEGASRGLIPSIGVVRVSSTKQAEESVPAQCRGIQQFADAKGYDIKTWLKKDMSASKPSNVIQFTNEIADTCDEVSAEAALFWKDDRSNRAGTEYGYAQRFALRSRGIDKVDCSAPVCDEAIGGVMYALTSNDSHQYVRALSMQTGRGIYDSKADGRTCHSPRVLYGTYKKFTSENGEVLRYTSYRNGIRQVLDPVTKMVKQTATKPGPLYTKLPREVDEYVPGHEDEVEIVRQIFELRYAKGYGSTRIAGILNSKKKKTSPTGTEWSPSSVEKIYMCPTYCGYDYSNTYGHAIFYNRAKGSPIEAPKPKKAGQDLVRWRRPIAHWVRHDYPEMVGFLELSIRSKAIAAIDLYHQRIAEGRVIKPRAPKSWQSLLGGKLQEITTGRLLKMTGYVQRDNGPKMSYYAVPRKPQEFPKGHVVNRSVPSTPVERLVLECIEETLLKAPGLRDSLIAQIMAQSEENQPDRDKREKLEKQTESLKASIKRVLAMQAKAYDSDIKDLFDQQVLALKDELVFAKRDLATTETSQVVSDEQASLMADEILSKLKEMLSTMPTAIEADLRQIVESLLDVCPVNLETLTIDVKLVVPGDMVNNAFVALMPSSSCKDGDQHNKWKPLTLACYEIEYENRCNSDCWSKPWVFGQILAEENQDSSSQSEPDPDDTQGGMQKAA